MIIFQPDYSNEDKKDFLCWTFYGEESGEDRKISYLLKNRDEFIELCQKKFKEIVSIYKKIVNVTTYDTKFIENFLEILEKEDIFDEVFTKEFYDEYIENLKYNGWVCNYKSVRDLCKKF